ncbi:MAG: hypothetical protein JJU36_05415 [Phycisphaeraceae bacterium]|nr:hypothetical protein [Phycisphaeraceae bacterium]
MSDHIAHLAICDDVFRLSMPHPEIHPTFKVLMAEFRDDAHMGSVTRTADLWSAQVIQWAGEQARLPEGQRDPLTMRKLAFVLGSLTHRSADRLTKPITKCWQGDDDSGRQEDEANESKIMQDIMAFREIYGGGSGPNADPFTAATLATPVSDGQAKLEEYFRVLLRRALIAMHTIKPDHHNIQPWLDAFFKGMQTFPKRLEQYARLAAQWDQAKVNKYLIGKRFYDREDELIRIARSIQHGSVIQPERIVAAVKACDQSQSRYARALAKAVEYLLAAGELYDGRLDLEEAQLRFDVGVPELSLQD